jgi:hypothetical protein
MRRKSLFYSIEDDNDQTDTDDIDLTDSDDENDDKKINPGPLNVDLVYSLNELETNNKTNTEEYRVLKKLQEERENEDNDDDRPVGLEIKASRYIKENEDDDNTDLLEDETVSKPNDYDDEQYTRFESTDMSVESFTYYLANEARYTNDANDYFANNLSDAIGKTAKAGARVASGAYGAAKAGATATAKAAYDAAKAGSPYVGKAAKAGAKQATNLIGKGYSAIKGSILALDKFYERHEANFTSLEKQLAILRKNVFLLKEIDNLKPYTNRKVISNIVAGQDHKLRSVLTKQIKFYNEFSKIVISSLHNQSEITSQLLEAANNKDLTNITLKNYASKSLIDNISKHTSDIDSIDGPNSNLVTAYESKEILMGNRVLLSLLPSKDISTIEDYIDAMSVSKVSIYKLNETIPSEIEALNKHELLAAIDLALELTRHLKDTKSEFNKIIGIKKAMMSTYKYFDIISNTEYFLTVDRKTRKEVSEYLKVVSVFMDRVYIDPFINLKNCYYNSLKYFTHYVKDVSKR